MSHSKAFTPAHIIYLSPENVHRIPRQPGTYALLFNVSTEMDIPVGRLGILRLQPGHYVYIGSARGPGGLAGRVQRHLRAEKRLHWHIDYITQHLTPNGILFTTHPLVKECDWVHYLLEAPDTEVPLPGLGSSDCRAGCPAHFLRVGPTTFSQLLCTSTGGQKPCLHLTV